MSGIPLSEITDRLSPRALAVWNHARDEDGGSLASAYLDHARTQVQIARARAAAPEGPLSDEDRDVVAFLRLVYPGDATGLDDRALLGLSRPYHRTFVRAVANRNAAQLLELGAHFPHNKGSQAFLRSKGVPVLKTGPTKAREDAILRWAGKDPDAYRARKAKLAAEETARRERAAEAKREETRLDKWGPDLVAWYGATERGYNVTPRMLSAFRSKQYRYKGDVIYPDVYVKRLVAEGREFREDTHDRYSKRKGDWITETVYRAMGADGTWNMLTKSEYLFGKWLQAREGT